MRWNPGEFPMPSSGYLQGFFEQGDGPSDDDQMMTLQSIVCLAMTQLARNKSREEVHEICAAMPEISATDWHEYFTQLMQFLDHHGHANDHSIEKSLCINLLALMSLKPVDADNFRERFENYRDQNQRHFHNDSSINPGV
jgi:hypothetical protein